MTVGWALSDFGLIQKETNPSGSISHLETNLANTSTGGQG